MMFAGTTVVAQDTGSTKNTAKIAEFGVKIDALEDVVDAVALAGALALLSREYPDWKFERASGFDGINSHFTNDLGAVVGDHEYELSKIRGAIFRNKSVSDKHRERGLELFGAVKEFVAAAYELERLLVSGDRGLAGGFYKTEILQSAETLSQSIGELSDAIDQAVKLSAL